MSIIRVKRYRKFTTVPNEIVNDKRLSLKAKGLLMIMLSYPDDWEFQIREVEKKMKDGKDSVRSGVEELIREGYVGKYRVRESGSGRFVGWEYIVRDARPTDMGNTEMGKSQVGESATTNTNKDTNTYKDNKREPEEVSKRKNNIEKEEKILIGENVLLSLTEKEKLINRMGKEKTEEYINKLDIYIGSKGTKYRSHYHTILMWHGRETERRMVGLTRQAYQALSLHEKYEIYLKEPNVVWGFDRDDSAMFKEIKELGGIEEARKKGYFAP